MRRAVLCLLAVPALATIARGQNPVNGLRPVPKMTSRAMAPEVKHEPLREGWNLQWRSPNVAPPTSTSSTNTNQFASTTQSNTLRPVDQRVELAPAPQPHTSPSIQQVAWAASQLSESKNQSILAPAPNNTQALDNLFESPFGENDVQELPRPQRPVPKSNGTPDRTKPSDPRSLNELGQELDSGSSLRDLLEKVRPSAEAPSKSDESQGSDRSQVDSPSDLNVPMDNPFNDSRSPADQAADDRSRDNAELPRKNTPKFDRNNDDDTDPVAKNILSCDEFRDLIREFTIKQVSLDISPPFRPDLLNDKDYERAKKLFDEKQKPREWRSLSGESIVKGRLVDLAYEKAVIQTEFGSTEELSLHRLSEADIAYISDNWGLPQECQLEQVAFQPRTWQRTIMTWQASNLCHKPLYFEDVNLERYGHTSGPVLQPLVSSAHFFVNIAVLPYKMGIHPPGECQYALGYYRPGNCAPWIVPPVPLSLKGGLTQAATMSGLFWLIP